MLCTIASVLLPFLPKKSSIVGEEEKLKTGKSWTTTILLLLSFFPGVATNLIFFLFPFCEKSLICLKGKSMTPHRGNTILFRSYQQLPRLRLGPSKGFLS